LFTNATSKWVAMWTRSQAVWHYWRFEAESEVFCHEKQRLHIQQGRL
jgi:hypothetical protein